MANKTSQEVQEEIIKSCKIQENIISEDNSSGTSPTAKQRKCGQDTTSISVSMKKCIKEKLDADANACNMNRSEYITSLITGAKLISFPDSVKILPQLALCYQVLSDIMDHIEDNNMPHEQLDKVVEALDNASFSMSCICNKIDALLPDDEEVTDDGN
ncbi:MAG: hypothetical protein SPD47_09525 [Oscillospiraceae bacterium]|nr:hypothetical protein [Oscillospiraceae bacterium]